MELVLKHPDMGPVDSAKDLVAIVVCEDPMNAPRACAMLKRVGSKAGVQGRLLYSWWTYDVLASASLRLLAASEAATADMVIIAAREGPGLPEGVKEWIRLWLATGEYHPRRRAMVALLEPDKKQSGPSRGVLSELKHLAEADDVDFFANGEESGWEAVLTGSGYDRPAIRPGVTAGAARGLPGGAGGCQWQ